MGGGKQYIPALFFAFLMQVSSGEPLDTSRVIGSNSCSTSGCHGGAGLNRGSYNIWKRYDPHFQASAILSNGRSKAMARNMGIGNATTAKSCTVCHDPMLNVSPAILAPSFKESGDIGKVSCANCHGGAENWLLSHTRSDYPKDALRQLGMRQLSTPYQRANNCVACHQTLSDELVTANHPPLIFELDGLLVAEPKHWEEEKDFSHAQTWLVGQAVALRESAAQAVREPSARRTAEIEAIKALLIATDTGWDLSEADLVSKADAFAKKISSKPIEPAQSRSILSLLTANRRPFQTGAFPKVEKAYRLWATGHYAERLALSIDRLNQSILAQGTQAPIPDAMINGLFQAAKPPKSFNADISENFVRKLDQLPPIKLNGD